MANLWTRDYSLIVVINFALFVSFQMLLPTIPLHAVNMGLHESSLGLVIGIFTLSAVATRPLVGREIDKRGKKGIFLFGLVICFASVLVYSWVVGLWLLFLLRLVHGIGWSISTTGTVAVAGDLIPPDRKGEGMGLFGLSSNLAMCFAPALGLFIFYGYNEQILFIVSALFTLAALLISLLINYSNTYLPEPEQEFNPDSPFPGKTKIIEMSALYPSLVVFPLTFIFGGVISFLAIFAESRGVENIGLFFTIYAATMVISRPLAGIISDKKGTDLVIVPTYIIVACSMVLIALADSYLYFVIAAILLGVGSVIYPTLLALTLHLAPVNRRGSAYATFFTVFDLGIGGGAMILGLIAYLVGYSGMYLFLSLMALAGLIAYLVLLRGSKLTDEAVAPGENTASTN